MLSTLLVFLSCVSTYTMMYALCYALCFFIDFEEYGEGSAAFHLSIIWPVGIPVVLFRVLFKKFSTLRKNRSPGGVF